MLKSIPYEMRYNKNGKIVGKQSKIKYNAVIVLLQKKLALFYYKKYYIFISTKYYTLCP